MGLAFIFPVLARSGAVRFRSPASYTTRRQLVAQGKKYTEKERELVRARLAAGETPADIAKDMKIAKSTISDWTKQFNADTGDKNLELLRTQKKAEFVNRAWELIGKCETLMERRLNRALENEDDLDRIFEKMISDCDDLTDAGKRAMAAKFAALKLENTKEIAIILGTLYDKQALANKEPTEIVGGQIVRYEDFHE